MANRSPSTRQMVTRLPGGTGGIATPTRRGRETGKRQLSGQKFGIKNKALPSWRVLLTEVAELGSQGPRGQ